MRRVGIVYEMRRRIGSGKGYGDDEIGGSKAKKNQYKRLTRPAREQLLQHRNAALPVRTGSRNPVVHRQRCKQSHQDQNQRWDRRKHAGAQERDPGLVAEGGEIIPPGEAHHAPPGMSVLSALPVSTLRTIDLSQKPFFE